MTSPVLFRSLALLGPLAVTALAWFIRRPERRQTASAFLAFAWNFVALWVVNVVAIRVGAWCFHAQGGMLFGVPVDLLMGWSLLWAVLPLILGPRIPIGILTAAFLWFDALVMPLCVPVIELGRGWLAIDVAAVALGAIPGLLLGRWTLEDRRLGSRAFLLVICFGTLILGVIPAAALTGETASSIAIWLA